MIKERVENRTTVVLNATSLQRVSMTRKNGLFGLAFLCVTIPLMLVAQPAEKKTLVGIGTWPIFCRLPDESFLGRIGPNRLSHENAFLRKIENSDTSTVSAIREDLPYCYASRRGAR